jgi:tight adherence protein C
MFNVETIALTGFLMASSFTVLVFLLVSGNKSRLESRLGELTDRPRPAQPAPNSVAQLAQSALPKMGNPLVPKDEEERTRLQTRLIHAGRYGRQAMAIFLGVKVLLMVTPVALGFLAAVAGIAPPAVCMIVGALFGILGLISPSFWLDNRKASRQTQFRRSLPDALDVLVICLEGGLSLPGAIRRVASELRTAHPALAHELNIVQREMQLGMTAGEALKKFADRCDLEEIRSLGSVIVQAERFGASLVKALRVHAESLREKRLLHAEEMAHKAATKILFPTLLCIFPGIFIVILGPAVIHAIDIFERLSRW